MNDFWPSFGEDAGILTDDSGHDWKYRVKSIDANDDGPFDIEDVHESEDAEKDDPAASNAA